MEKFIASLQKALMPVANKISGNKFMGALGRTFQLLLPVIMIGSFACLGAFLDIPAWQNFVTSTGLQFILMTIQSLTLSIIALYVVIVLSYQYGQQMELNPASSSVISLMAFLFVTPHELYTSIPTQWLGYTGLFGAIFIALVVPRFIGMLIKNRIYVRMPKGVPPVVEDAFASIVPALFVAIIAMIVSWLLTLTPFENFHNIIYTIIQVPVKSLTLSLPGMLVMQILTTLLMYCGIHGETLMATVRPIAMASGAENLAALAAGQPLPNIITNSFTLLCQPGGIGGTLGLAFLLTFAAKSKRLRTLGRISVGPAIFNINEPLIFGIPILLNPLLFIPYILSPIVCTSLSYFAYALGIVPRLTGVEVAWTMPQIVSGFLAQGWQTALLQAALLAISTLIWFPFFKMVDRQIAAREENSKGDEIPL
jgi:PTS system cellobiose-specific IIC component